MLSIRIIRKLMSRKFLQAVSLLCVYILLCELFVRIVTATYSFGGFSLAQESRHDLVLPVLMFFLLIVPSDARNIKSLFVLLSLFFLLIPAAVLCALQDSSFTVFISLVFSVCAVVVFWHFFSLLLRARRPFGENIKQTVKSINYWTPFLIMVVVLGMLAIHVDFAFRYSFADVYDFRFEFNDSLQFPLNYLMPFAGGPLAAFLAALAFFRRQWNKLALVLLCGFLFYGFSTHKAYLFFPIFSVLIAYATQFRIGMFYLIAMGFAAFSIPPLLFGDPWADIFSSLFANRLVFLPAQIHYAFFDEFSKIGYFYWAESKISLGLVNSPINMPSVNYIAEIMVGDSNIGANVGWIANGYMNLGLFGVLVYSVMLGFLLALIDRWSDRLDSPILVASFSVPLFSIVTSNDLLTSMLTGGMLLMLCLAWLLINQTQVYRR